MRRLAFIAVWLPCAALAHGGESHGAPPPTSNAQVAVTRGASAGGIGDRYEVLVRRSTPDPDGQSTLMLFLSDAFTNEPIAGAEVTLVLTGKSERRLAARPAQRRGVYEARAQLGDETPEVMVRVSSGEDGDLVPLGALKAPPRPAPPAPAASSPPWWLGGALLGAAVGFLAARALGRRREALP